jgi:arylformamidase
LQIHDLSMPLERDHIRWPFSRGVRGNFDDGDLFEVSWLQTSCHGFTHLDAPRHMVPGGATTTDLTLDRVVGPASIIDISDVEPEQAVDASLLQSRGGHIAANEIILFRSGWDEQRDWHTEAFWRDSPYLTRDACEWLLAQQPTAVAFDFPQDWTIRLLLDGEVRPIVDHVSHDVLLRNGVTLIEYLIGTTAITQSRVFFSAAPMKLLEADGAPARVYAIEGML